MAKAERSSVEEKNYLGMWILGIIIAVFLLVGIFYSIGFGYRAYNRYQKVADARNEIAVNEMKIQQTEQLVKVEQQKADIRVVEAEGIGKAQDIINKTLTDKYLQHEAIMAQEKMADSPNHTTIYIPSGQNGLPIVATTDAK